MIRELIQMTDDSSKLEIEASPGGGKLIVGGPSANKIANQLSDLISPFSELAGALGDHLRIYRVESVKRHLERAKEIAASRSVDVPLVNPKNLIPWIENSSLENEEQSEISEIWSRLLLSGSSDFDSELAALTESLKRIGSKEANLLKEIVINNENYPKSYFEHISTKINKNVCGIIFNSLLIESPENINDFLINGNFESRFIYSKLAHISYTNKNGMELRYLEKFGSIALTLCHILERERLAKISEFHQKTEYGNVSILYIEALPLGYSLINRCYPT